MLHDFPGVLRDIAEACGEGVALKVAHEYGGQRVNIPARAVPGSRFADSLGLEAAEAVIACLGPGNIDIPLGPVSSTRAASRALAIRIARLDDTGASAAQIAREERVASRTVHRHRARRGGRKPKDPNQPEFPL